MPAVEIQLPDNLPANPSAIAAACKVADRAAAEAPLVVGVNGAQGSGKSTLAQIVALALRQVHGLETCLLSLDDFYLTHAVRQQLARDIHPMCATRGVPGTHDIPLMETVLEALAQGRQVSLPKFDKLADDRMPSGIWPEATKRPDVIILEGWCVGLRAEDVPPWQGPINTLEEVEDPTGEWFAWSLATLARDYAAIWNRIDLLVSIEVPDLDTVIASRLAQEKGLAADSDRPRMDRKAIVRFVQHYERYTRALWASMPERADMLFRRDRDFAFTHVHG